MMPTVNISQPLFKRLQKHTVPLVDDLESVLTKILDFYEKENDAVSGDEPAPEEQESKVYSPGAPPNLKYTTPTSIVLEGEPINDKAKIYWNPLLFECVRVASHKLNKTQLKSLISINHMDDHGGTEKGYRYIAEAGISVQGQDANAAWAAIYKLARGANLSIEVEFEWMDKPGAAYPGRKGKFIVEGK